MQEKLEKISLLKHRRELLIAKYKVSFAIHLIISIDSVIGKVLLIENSRQSKKNLLVLFDKPAAH